MRMRERKNFLCRQMGKGEKFFTLLFLLTARKHWVSCFLPTETVHAVAATTNRQQRERQ